jgi:hypothetical protein
MIIKLLIWIVLWFGTFGIYNLILVKRGYTYTKKPWLSMILYLGASAISYFIFKEEILNIVSNTNWIVIVIYLSSLLGIYILLNTFTEDPGNIQRAEYTHIKYSFLLFKSIEIFFQDILIAILLYLFRSFIDNSLYFVLSFTLFFGLIHTPLSLVWKSNVVKVIVLISFTLSCILPLLYLLPIFNFAYLYCIHWLFYIIGGISYRLSLSFRKYIKRE